MLFYSKIKQLQKNKCGVVLVSNTLDIYVMKKTIIMDIVRIKLFGKGFDVTRGIVTKKDYNKIKNSSTLDNVWTKKLGKKIEKNFTGFKTEFNDYGVSKGDLIIQVNGEEFINIPISVLDGYSFGDGELIELEGYHYPITDGVVVTSVQELEGTFMDVIFITAEEFDFSKFKFIRKEIQDENEKTLFNLIAEVYYDGDFIMFDGDNTDLRMSNINFDIGKKEKVSKNEKNDNR